MSGVRPSQISREIKFNKIFLNVRTFYSNHFPTDKKTFKWRVSIIGLILSILTVLYAKSYILTSDKRTENIGNKSIGNDSKIATVIIYTVIALAVTYELYYGLEIGDRKQLTPWILFKIQEIIWNIASIAFCVMSILDSDEESTEKYILPILILILIILSFVINTLLTYVVASKSIRQFRGRTPKVQIDDEVVYDSCDNV